MPRDYAGILFIGDPHLASRAPGFRTDAYPQIALEKFAWCLDYARQEKLLPAILGDLFHQPRDNANWLLGEVLALLSRQPVIGLYGNHDCRQDALSDHDSFTVVLKSGFLQLIGDAANGLWRGAVSGRPVIIGGTNWGRPLPATFDAGKPGEEKPTVFWMTHHDITLPGYLLEGRIDPREIPGVDIVINGHVHAPLAEHRIGETLWVTPGNIARVTRNDQCRVHTPAVLRVAFDGAQWRRTRVTVPHLAFDEVFHPEVEGHAAAGGGESAFIQGLAELQTRRTQTGAGLRQFLELHEEKFEPEIRSEIWQLFKEVET